MTSPDRKAALMPEKGQKKGTMIYDSYGKSRVNVTKVTRHSDRHDLKEISVDMQLEGDFREAFTEGDNSSLVATDSMKNTIYVLAAKNELKDIESFAKIVATHFLETYVHVSMVTVSITEDRWQRIDLNGKPHPHAFSGAGGERRATEIQMTRAGVVIESGIDDLRVVKTTDSEFCGFVRDEYTTLPEAKDRIFGTTVSARWLYDGEKCEFDKCYNLIRQTLLEIFATHFSLSIQQTLYEIGQTALERCGSIKEITLTMPNQHRIPFNLQPFGLENRNEIFVNTEEPYGLITATISRSE